MSVTLSPGSLVATDCRPGERAPRRRRFAWLLAGLAALLPALPWLIALPGFGRLPSNDYYAVLLQMGRPDGGFVRQPAAWLGMRSNEHHVAVPALVYAANILLCDGDNRGLSAWCLLVLGATLALLLSLLPSGLRRQPALFALAGLLLGVLVFNPVQAHNVIMGFSGVMWLTANLLAVAALAALCRHARDGRRRWLDDALACAWAGVLTYSSSLSLWPALLVAALVLRVRWPALATMAAGAVTAVAFDVATYVRPPDHPELGAEAGGTLWGFVARYVGSLVTAEDLAALLLGGLSPPPRPLPRQGALSRAAQASWGGDGEIGRAWAAERHTELDAGQLNELIRATASTPTGYSRQSCSDLQRRRRSAHHSNVRFTRQGSGQTGRR